jgi:mannose-6-phosphate isomerase-like protein (cupin superfamily)
MKQLLKNVNVSHKDHGDTMRCSCICQDIKSKLSQSYHRGEISLQRHSHRKEHWYIVNGKGIVTKNGSEIRVFAGDSVDLPVNEVHRIKNIDNENLVFIEIAQGDYLREDDIVRLKDKYGRA